MDCKKKKVINVGVDLETLSTFPTAAIISIAAKVFTPEHNELELHEYKDEFLAYINPMSCIVNGFHVEEETCKWWATRSKEAKESIISSDVPQIKIKSALRLFTEWIEKIKSKYECDDVLIWMEGTDFDGSILRNALRRTFPEKGRDAVPWGHRQLRDARTFILEGLKFFFGETENPFERIPKPEKPFLHHDAMGDVEQMIWNIRYVTKLFNENIKK